MNEFLQYQARMMRQLLGWAAVSAGIGVGLMQSQRALVFHFGGMTLAWALINALIALFALRGVRQKASQNADATTVQGWVRHLHKLLWLNFGLDVLYIAIGVGLVRWDTSNPMLVGFGWAVIVQGAFLLLFDGWHGWRVGKRFITQP
ncbi:MAG: hypothetical protein SNJ72_08830 [Fimbriimonadales bacterium]